ncbi:oligopeptide ABC transporter, periplasmic oligopeptide-binding protein [Scytonema sp. HK-05]|uniref:ABC transporter substrate-binding protein n=1 Tax=Scytonema sp. HK-05 TaxID=1137095 RepID=UPI0009358D51|nr:ABC transporter substrate-binding protein [Scytonema sp. HK-05]OKH60498.1 peptide ABC transporter substrate-binding protein [Scytonema sp. HK-05]BAY44695.1 oligopeptide ABC transporter, periplasmic oligopeptide-binding protein [Scytonema sp. HK-05]
MNTGIFKQIFRRSWILALLGIWVTLALNGCNPSQFKSQAAQVPQLVRSMLSDPQTFNYPLNQDASTTTLLGLLFDGLITQNLITGKVEPVLAESWQISDDKLRIVFTLREGLKWSDGQPLTVDDVVFSYNDIYLNEAIPTDARDTLRIGESGKLPTVRKVDERRVEFSVPEPFRPFLLNTGYPILPAHALQKSVKTKDTEGKPTFLAKWRIDTPPDQIIVNGPYKLERYETSQRVVLRRNPYYWRKDDKGNSQPYIERMIWQIVESTDTSLVQFRSGSLDSVGVSPEFFSLLKRQEKQGKFTIYNGGPAAGTNFVWFNLNKGKRNGKPLVNPVKSRWFNTVEFRQAIAYAIDRQTMINNTFRGLGELQNSPISVQSPYYLSAKEGLKVYDYNPQKAKELLLKAGFKYNDRGELLDAEGNRVRFTLVTNAGNKIREALGSQIKQDLSKIGIQVDFTPLAWSAFTDKVSNTLDWEAALMGLTGGLEPNDGANVWAPEGGLHMFNQKPQPGQKPIQGWEVAPWEAEIAKLYIQAAREFDEAKVKAIYAETQQITQEYLPFIYLVNAYSLAAVRDRVEGIQYSALGGPFWNIHEIKVTD